MPLPICFPCASRKWSRKQNNEGSLLIIPLISFRDCHKRRCSRFNASAGHNKRPRGTRWLGGQPASRLHLQAIVCSLRALHSAETLAINLQIEQVFVCWLSARGLTLSFLFVCAVSPVSQYQLRVPNHVQHAPLWSSQTPGGLSRSF